MKKFCTIVIGALAAAGAYAAAPGGVYQSGEALSFAAPVGSSYIVKDWRGNVIRSGQTPAAGELTLPSLPNGYYLLQTGENQEPKSFMIVPANYPHNPDSYFAMDTAQSWLGRPDPKNPRFPGEGFTAISDILQRTGTQNVRERLSWNEIEAAPGQFDGKQYLFNHNLLKARNIGVLGMYHSAPKWAKVNTQLVPDDLLAVYHFGKTISQKFDAMTAWEFWNEEDIDFSKEGVWDYAAALKAASLGYKAGNPKAAVLIGGLANSMPLANYANEVMKNGIADYIDVFNIHTYRTLMDQPATIKDVDEFMARHQIADKKLYITEIGSLAEGSGRVDSYMPGIRAHSPEQELLMTEYLPKTLIQMQSLGVDRSYFFVIAPYNEQNGSKDWGLLRRDYTAKPALAAFATLNSQLGAAKYLGSLTLGNDIRGFLYQQPDGKQTLAFWTATEFDNAPQNPAVKLDNFREKSFSINAPDGEYTLVDAVGTPQTVKSVNGKLVLTSERFVRFVNGLSGLAPQIAAKVRPAPVKTALEDKTVIFQLRLSNEFKVSPNKEYAELAAIPGKAVLTVYNLSHAAKTGTIQISGATTDYDGKTINVGPFAKTEIPLVITPVIPDGSYMSSVTVNGKFNDKTVSPLSLVICDGAKMLRETRKVALSNTNDPVNWRKNAAGPMSVDFVAADNAVHFKVKFPENIDRWIYPEYTLQLPQESMRGAVGLAFEIKATPGGKAAKKAIVMAVMTDKTVYLPFQVNGDGWEEKVLMFAGAIDDPDKIRVLRIGLNPSVAEIEYSIRNVKVLY